MGCTGGSPGGRVDPGGSRDSRSEGGDAPSTSESDDSAYSTPEKDGRCHREEGIQRQAVARALSFSPRKVG